MEAEQQQQQQYEQARVLGVLLLHLLLQLQQFVLLIQQLDLLVLLTGFLTNDLICQFPGLDLVEPRLVGFGELPVARERGLGIAT